VKTRVYAAAWFLLVAWTVAGAQPSTLDATRDASTITYRLVHPLHEIEAMSKDMHYRLDVDVATRMIKSVAATVDVLTFDSGNSNRDSHAMEVIDAITYPDARFSSTGVVQTGDSVRVTGKLTFHGVTRDVHLAAETKWSEHKLAVNGGFNISLEAFNVERPSLLMIPVEDTLKFSIVAVFEWK
jgi:polyisoprenoid-binding protein YceI